MRSSLEAHTLSLPPIALTDKNDAATPDISDLQRVADLSHGKVHLTFGSALDIFGGKGVTMNELIAWNEAHDGTAGARS